MLLVFGKISKLGGSLFIVIAQDEYVGILLPVVLIGMIQLERFFNIVLCLIYFISAGSKPSKVVIWCRLVRLLLYHLLQQCFTLFVIAQYMGLYSIVVKCFCFGFGIGL